VNVITAPWPAASEALPHTERYPRIHESSDETNLEISREAGVVCIRRGQPFQPYEITLRPRNRGLYVPRVSCQTTFSLDSIFALMDRTDFAWICDNIARYEDSNSVRGVLEAQLFAYVSPGEFVGKRLLDFGCGSGASTMAMARLLPDTEIVGVELDPVRVEFANHLKASQGVDNVSFLCSPSGTELAPGIGLFDFVMLSAVYEHLLPNERKTAMPLLWSAMKPGGKIFINQTPYRYSPLEAHSTGLPLVNYMPDRLAHLFVRCFAGRNQEINASKDWNVHLRGGLRGGTEREIVNNLTSGNRRSAKVMQPHRNGVHDRASLWLSRTSSRRFRRVKKLLATGFRLTDRCLGTIPALNLELVVEKVR
jgi:2-polyprenyl-3-methyl-5-hydroxy-6-metoxy-1,4-benzoquinol methylase